MVVKGVGSMRISIKLLAVMKIEILASFQQFTNCLLESKNNARKLL